jgi:hypothetical protein
MKKTIMIGCMLLIALSCRAQQIVPVEKSIGYMEAQNGIPKGTYLKDVNNLFNKYLGTWKGSFDNKNYTFVITMFKHEFLGVTEDKLLIRYLITDSSGAIIEDTRSLPNGSPKVIHGNYFAKDTSYYACNYSGKESLCGQKGTVFIYIKNNTNNTQMYLGLEPDKDMLLEQNCPGLKLATQLLPINGMTITKQ